MDDRDIHDLRTTVQGIERDMGRLDVLSLAYQEGKIALADVEVTFSNAQKAGLRNAFNALYASVETVANTAIAAGTVNPGSLLRAQEQPALVREMLRDEIEGFSLLLQSPALQPDGTYRRTLDADVEQTVKGRMATLTASVRVLMAIFKTRVP